jgi:hypothetical protein
MAVNKIELKRSAVPGRVPTTSSLDLGELAINTYDGKVFFKQSGSLTRIVELATTSGSVTSASYALTASYAMNGGDGAAFPYTGSAQITGSLGVTGSFGVSGFSIFSGTISGSQPTNNPSSSLLLISGNIIPTGSAGTTGSAVFLNTIMSASANNQTLVGLDINPAFNNGAFTGVSNIGLRLDNGNAQFLSNGGGVGTNIVIGKSASGNQGLTINGNSGQIIFRTGTGGQSLQTSNDFLLGSGGSNGTIKFTLFSTGNLTLQNGGTFTDAGFRLDVSGSTRLNGNTRITGSLDVSGSITTTGTLTAQTLVVQTITSSIIYSSGSNIFGNNITNTQTFTGSVGITGSLSITGSSYSFNNTLNTYFITSSAPSGSNVIFSQPTGSYTSAFFKYTISSGSNARAGEVISVWNSTTSSYTDYTTTDIGNTAAVISLVAISGNNVVYTVSSSNGGWTIKSLVVYI